MAPSLTRVDLYRLLGSVEYVEDRQVELKQLGIAYLNL